MSIEQMDLLGKLSFWDRPKNPYKHFLQWRTKYLWNSGIAKKRKLMYTERKLDRE